MAAILVVDDDDVIRDTLCELLSANHNCQTADTAEQALAQLQQPCVAPAQRQRRQCLGGTFVVAAAAEQQQPACRGGRVAPAFPDLQQLRGRGRVHGAQPAGTVKLGSAGSGTPTSRSQPSFSSLRCWIATAFAFASRSGIAWYSETQQRYSLYASASWPASL